MHPYLWLALLGCLVAACTPIRVPVTPAAIASTPTAIVLAAMTPAPVTFMTGDGVPLTGTRYGAGTTALIFSNMGDNEPAPWERMAPLFAEQGYLVLTYHFRYPSRTSHFTPEMAAHTVDDLQAAVAFVRTQGAQKIVLVGASLGGMATAKVAATVQPVALVVMAAPADLLEFDFQVTADELAAITAPKLFIVSQDDTIVPAAATQHMFDLAAEPKEMQLYPSSAHGLQLLTTDHADALRQRLSTFITAHAPPGE